jgi:SpoVK/Ycf46/Vps4 family AAA+-type ATPase
MQNPQKPLSRPLVRDESPQPRVEKYEIVKLPDDHWRQLGKDLVLDPRIRRRMLRYAEYRLLYGARGRCYGIMTLLGPPGTGKSDTVRWLGDAIMRRLNTQGKGLVINATRLFDDRLGQSPKLVEELQADIELSASRGVTIVILDDAESLYMSRQQSLGKKGDPTDVAKATTALLHGLDRLRYNANVLQFATLNMADVVDEAIESRSDLILNFALPNAEQRLAILGNLMKGLAGERVLDALVAATEGRSGRELSKLEMLAYVEGTADNPEDLTERDFLSAVGLTPDSVVSSDEQQIPELKEEEACKRSSTNGYLGAAIPQKSKSPWLWRRFARQPAISSFRA